MDSLPNSLGIGVETIVGRSFDEPDAEQSITRDVSAAYRGANPSFTEAKILSAECDKQILTLDEFRDRQIGAAKKAPLTRVSTAGPRPDALTKHDLNVYRSMVLATGLGVAVAWHALASYVSESTTIGSLTDNYQGSLLISGIAVTGAVVLKAGASVCNSDEEERSYYKAIRRYAVISILLYIATLSLTFAPRHLDIAALQEALTDGTANSSLAEAIKAVAPYFLTGTQLLAEMLSAPLIFYLATQKHLAGRPVVVAKHDLQVLHENEIEALNGKITALVKSKATYEALLAFHSSAEAAAIAAALRFHRQTEADRAQHLARAGDAFNAQRFGGALS